MPGGSRAIVSRCSRDTSLLFAAADNQRQHCTPPPPSNALNALSQTEKRNKLECGPMPNLMVALPNIGGALCSTPQSLADAHY